MADSGATQAMSDVDHKAVRLRRYIDLVVEDKLSFTLLRAMAADISLTGMRILCDQYLSPKTRYLFTMKEHPNLEMRGEVRWVKPSGPSMFACGVLFLNLSPEVRDKLDRFLVAEHEYALAAAHTTHAPSPLGTMEQRLRPGG